MKDFENCQKFTPLVNVKFVLDSVNYKKNIFNKKVLENSCGDGNFLVEIVERYIKEGLRLGLSKNIIKKSIEKNIYAAEIDSKHRKKCIRRLIKISSKYSIYGIRWNVFEKDTLTHDFKTKFNFVIGNPPYIIYRNLELKTRELVRNVFETCQSGQFDYFYAFIEYGIKSLTKDGKLAYIIPEGFLKNVFADDLREYVKPLITNIYDYNGDLQFKDALTSSIVIVLDKANTNNFIEYENLNTKEQLFIDKSKLKKKWIFSRNELLNGAQRKFKEYFNIFNSIATLSNESFLLENPQRVDGIYFESKGIKLESKLVRRAFAPKSVKNKKEEWIIFPYYYKNGELCKIEENDLELDYPGIFEYLLSQRIKLNNRKADKAAKWYEYGRSQSLRHLNQPKLMISSVFTDKLYVYQLGQDEIPYSGFVVTCKNDNYTLEDARRILESENLVNYINSIGTSTAGKSKRFTVEDIKEYKF